MRDAGHLSEEEFQVAKDAVLGQPRTDPALTSEHPTAVIPLPPLVDEASAATLAISNAPLSAPEALPKARHIRRRWAVLGLTTVLVVGSTGGAYALIGSRSTVSHTTTAPSPPPAPTLADSPSPTVPSAVSPEATTTLVPLNAAAFKDAPFVKDCEKAGGQARTESVTPFREADSSGTNVTGAIVVGACGLGAGSSPDQVYDYVQSPTGLILDKTLIATEEGLIWLSSNVDAEHLSMRFKGYSTADIPKCCPDIDVTRSFSWDPEMSWLDDNPPTPAPAPATVQAPPTQQYVQVPDLLGLDDNRARNILFQAHLRLGFVTYTNGDPSLAARTNHACPIVRQQPAPGSQVQRNSLVSVVEDCPTTGNYQGASNLRGKSRS
jgi:hypothetical protein